MRHAINSNLTFVAVRFEPPVNYGCAKRLGLKLVSEINPGAVYSDY
jgi:hypothetical protein